MPLINTHAHARMHTYKYAHAHNIAHKGINSENAVNIVFILPPCMFVTFIFTNSCTFVKNTTQITFKT